jgi:hypothetical protein
VTAARGNQVTLSPACSELTASLRPIATPALRQSLERSLPDVVGNDGADEIRAHAAQEARRRR